MDRKRYKEVDTLCESLSSIPGIKVAQGAVVNNRVYVWFSAYDQRLLFPIARGVSHNYGCIQFNLNVTITDTPDEFNNYVMYELESKSELSVSLIEADKMSNFIHHYMTGSESNGRYDMLKFSGMDKVIDEYKIINRDRMINDIVK